VEFTEGPDSSVVYTPLQPQHAWTIEIGTRGEINFAGSMGVVAVSLVDA
jgi:hypothetical protein